MGVGGVSPPPRRWPRLGAGRLALTARTRNFSNWAYWRLHLERVVAADDSASTRDDDDDDVWRARTRSNLAARLGTHPTPVPLDVETTDEVDCGDYTRARVLFDVEETMSVPAFLLVPHA